MLRQYKLKDYKFRLVLWVLILSVIGIMVIGSANGSYQMKQMIGMGVGIVFMIMVSLMDYLWISNFYWIYYIGGLVLLIAVRFFGTEVNGAKRWIDFGGFSFQPSDIMKIVVIIFFTRFFMKHEEDLNKPQTILKAVGLVAIPWFLIYKQPDLSTSIVVLLIFCTIYFIAGLSSKIIGGMILICIPLVVIGAMLVTQPDQKILKGYQHDRIMGWLQPEKYPDISYQQTNSKIAIGSGQLYGKGLNNSDVNSVKNGNFIAEPQTDFIFAVAGTVFNIVGPKILGNSTGLSSFWVLFSILFFGGLWGFVGMIIGVPFFAVIYDVITRLVMRGLRYNQRDDMLMAYDEQYVKKSKITPRQEKLWSEEEKQELTQEKTEQKEQPESVINEGESDEDRKEL